MTNLAKPQYADVSKPLTRQRATDGTSRRQFVKVAAASVSSWSLGQYLSERSVATAADFTEPVKEASGLTAYQKDGTVQVRFDNQPLLAYRAQPTLKYPYFYPLNGPQSGLSLTTESCLPYPHHRGLWLGCDPLNGGNYWADNGLESGQIRSKSLKLVDVSPQRVTLQQTCDWLRQSSRPFHDEREFVVHHLDDQRWALDCSFRLKAQEPIEIQRAKHSFFAMRAAADISPAYGGTMFNSEGGINAEGTYGRTAKWCGYFGRRKQNLDVTEGIVIMNHPENFGGNCPWFTRDYGHLSPSPFNFLDQPWTMAKDQWLELKYRVVLFAGMPESADLPAVYEAWLG